MLSICGITSIKGGGPADFAGAWDCGSAPCSSGRPAARGRGAREPSPARTPEEELRQPSRQRRLRCRLRSCPGGEALRGRGARRRSPPAASQAAAGSARLRLRNGGLACLPRSEEHTSELQSLMRISYAVFCLKKKKH